MRKKKKEKSFIIGSGNEIYLYSDSNYKKRR